MYSTRGVVEFQIQHKTSSPRAVSGTRLLPEYCVLYNSCDVYGLPVLMSLSLLTTVLSVVCTRDLFFIHHTVCVCQYGTHGTLGLPTRHNIYYLLCLLSDLRK